MWRASPSLTARKKCLATSFCSGMTWRTCFTAAMPDVASRSTLDSSLLVGLDVLCDGRRAFLNCTRNTLISGLVTLLPSHSTVVEILETVPVDAR